MRKKYVLKIASFHSICNVSMCRSNDINIRNSNISTYLTAISCDLTGPEPTARVLLCVFLNFQCVMVTLITQFAIK